MPKSKNGKPTDNDATIGRRTVEDTQGQGLLPNKQPKDPTPAPDDVERPDDANQYVELSPERKREYSRVNDFRLRQGMPLLSVKDFLAQYPEAENEGEEIK